MTKKDYIALANLIDKNETLVQTKRGITHVIKRAEFMYDICEYLKKDNPKFNEIKFREASGDIIGINA
tara:strand:+ start:285 stop:488 length:204 start_codon:yes stop_codon:yes gene_type:complete